MIDMNKNYKTRNNKEVRIYAVDGGMPFPVHGAVKRDGEWSSNQWTAGGAHSAVAPFLDDDLIEAKPRIKYKRALLIYESKYSGVTGKICESVESAKTFYPGGKVLAIVEIDIDCEEGEGL